MIGKLVAAAATVVSVVVIIGRANVESFDEWADNVIDIFAEDDE